MVGAWINACPFQKRLSQGGEEEQRELLEATITTARRKRGKRRRLKIDDLDHEPKKK
jgi:hypothetical protein